MYQTEDLIRAFDFDLNQIREYVIKHIPVQENEKKQLILWYAEVITQMKHEGLDEKGHLMSTQRFVSDLESLKDRLLKKDTAFKEVWVSALPTISNNKEVRMDSDIQVCINGIYGLLLLRLNGKPVSQEILDQADKFGDVLSYLSYRYKQQNFTNPN